jgi:hypothetical protein
MVTCLSDGSRRGAAVQWADMAPRAMAVSLLALWDDQSWASVAQSTLRDEVEVSRVSIATPPLKFILPYPSGCGTCAPIRDSQSEEIGPHGLWRTTAPIIVRSAPTDYAPEVARLPVNSALWPIDVGEAWSRVYGRAGVVTYTGYVRTSFIRRTNK